MSIYYDPITGHPSLVEAALVRRISAFTRTRSVTRFKIGITNNPEVRFAKAYKRSYDEMLILYRTSSINNVSELETLLVEHNWSFARNMISGGGGSIGKPPYFLYVAVRYR